MKVFMLGWEFPPYISGGVGTACQGLTQALLDIGVYVLFMLPRPVQQQVRPRMGVVQQTLPAVSPPPAAPGTKNGWHSPRNDRQSDKSSNVGGGGVAGAQQTSGFPYVPTRKQVERIAFRTVDVMLWPYLTPQHYQEMLLEQQELKELGVTPPPDPLPAHALLPEPAPQYSPINAEPLALAPPPPPPPVEVAPPAPPAEASFPPAPPPAEPPAEYAPTLLDETHRYARIALAVARKETFDVVHAHDWMTFEAAIAVAHDSGKPLVLQIHSTEHDRTPYGPDPMIIETERAGMLAADRVIAVSKRVKEMLVERYGIASEKIEVIYNAVDGRDEMPARSGPPTFHPRGKLVLFLGRITAQKGPEHFLAAARKVLAVYPDVKFVMAGDGDRRLAMEQLADELGIGERVMFTGFLSRPEVDTLFQTADVYVMPSVSEPFGLVSLEALRNDVPVIISKQSGVAEMLHHVLKVNFWDTDDLANKILAVLRFPALATTLREQGQDEVRQLTWHDAARDMAELYDRLVQSEEPLEVAAAPAPRLGPRAHPAS